MLTHLEQLQQSELRPLGLPLPTPYSTGGCSVSPGPALETSLSPGGGHREPECLCEGSGALFSPLQWDQCLLCHALLRWVRVVCVGARCRGLLPRKFSQELPPSLATETGLLGLHKASRNSRGFVEASWFYKWENQGPRGQATCLCVSQSARGPGTLNLGKCQTLGFAPMGGALSSLPSSLTHVGTLEASLLQEGALDSGGSAGWRAKLCASRHQGLLARTCKANGPRWGRDASRTPAACGLWAKCPCWALMEIHREVCCAVHR